MPDVPKKIARSAKADRAGVDKPVTVVRYELPDDPSATGGRIVQHGPVRTTIPLKDIRAAVKRVSGH